jgi:hypothetical protein
VGKKRRGIAFLPEAEKKRRSLAPAGWGFFAVQVILFFHVKLGSAGGRFSSAVSGVSWSEYCTFIPRQILIGVAVGGGIYIYRRFFKIF